MCSSCRHVIVLLGFCVVLWPALHTPASESLPITGRVVDFRAQPVEGARVVLYEEAIDRPAGRRTFVKLAETGSLSDGQFSLIAAHREEMSPNRLWLIAHKEGFAMCWTAEDPGTRSVALVLGKPGQLGGAVVDEAGRPVAGARISPCLKNEMMLNTEPDELPLPGSESWQVRRTDNEGRFLFDNIPADTTADFRIEAPGRAPVWTFCEFGLVEGGQYPAGRTDIRIVLAPETRIEGRVVDGDSGKAVSDVRVLARPHERPGSNYCPTPASVDPNGRFTLAGLTSGRYRLEAIAQEGQRQEWFGEAPVMMVQAGQMIPHVELAVNRGAGLDVLICEPDSHAGVEGVQVTVSSGTSAAKAITDANGLARLRVPAGKQSIQGMKPLYGFSSNRDVQVEKGQTHLEEMQLIGLAAPVSGTVVDPQGHALAGASVMHWPFWLLRPSDAKGQFEYTYYTTGPASERILLARHEPSGLANIVELKAASGTRRIDGQITLQPAHSLTGRVTDPNGTSIPAAYVRLVLCSPQRSPRRISVVTEVTTDSNGEYRIRAVPVPPSDFDAHFYAVVAHAADHNEASVDPVLLGGSVEEPIRLNTIVLRPTDQEVSGIVVDANGKPLPGVLVETPGFEDSSWRENAVQPHRQVLSDNRGRFRIEGVCRGPVDIIARTPPPTSQEGTTHAAGGERAVKIVPGQTLAFAKSLLGARSPDWSDLGMSDMAPELDGKAVLLCFVDLQQRPSRHTLAQLARERAQLAERDVTIVGVQTVAGKITGLQDRAAGELTTVAMANPPGNLEDLRRTWGIQSLPWLVLIDKDRTIRAEGFAPSQIGSTLSGIAGIR